MPLGNNAILHNDLRHKVAAISPAKGSGAVPPPPANASPAKQAEYWRNKALELDETVHNSFSRLAALEKQVAGKDGADSGHSTPAKDNRKGGLPDVSKDPWRGYLKMAALLVFADIGFDAHETRTAASCREKWLKKVITHYKKEDYWSTKVSKFKKPLLNAFKKKIHNDMVYHRKFPPPSNPCCNDLMCLSRSERKF